MKKMEGRPKIEIVRVSSIERANFRPLDGVQLRAAYSHVRIGMFCMEPEEKIVCENKPPIEQTRKYKKNMGPVSRLLRRRHQATCLETKSCDNIYNVNRNNTSSDWKINQVEEAGLQGCHSNSLDWRVGRTVNSSSDKLNWRDGSRSTEQLSKSAPITSNLSASSTKSKLVSLLKRLSPRLSRPGSKVSLPSSPTICPWVQVEYATDSINSPKRDESQVIDVSFQQELEINELKKKIIGVSPSKPKTETTKSIIKAQILVHPTIEVQSLERNRIFSTRTTFCMCLENDLFTTITTKIMRQEL